MTAKAMKRVKGNQNEEEDDEWASDKEDTTKPVNPNEVKRLSGKARDRMKVQMAEARQRAGGFSNQRDKNNKQALNGGMSNSSGTHSGAERKNLTVAPKKDDEDDGEINVDDI